ncbi:hypothetical protein OPT61_g8983 [Boeremia exigua]|uniref:Uncharacterized protein n=1 Tax=Boeremia exigua TaxID=749465 RepID=A0ACC2HW02_9PLEO|nr:hypothetical protein OPT61_g8983 [Boeremia exigua]
MLEHSMNNSEGVQNTLFNLLYTLGAWGMVLLFSEASLFMLYYRHSKNKAIKSLEATIAAQKDELEAHKLQLKFVQDMHQSEESFKTIVNLMGDDWRDRAVGLEALFPSAGPTAPATPTRPWSPLDALNQLLPTPLGLLLMVLAAGAAWILVPWS